MLSFAVRRHFRTDNPAHGIKKPKVRKMERFLSDAEISSLAKSLLTYEVEGGIPYVSNSSDLTRAYRCHEFHAQWIDLGYRGWRVFRGASSMGPVFSSGDRFRHRQRTWRRA
jgi:hypothetical protein